MEGQHLEIHLETLAGQLQARRSGSQSPIQAGSLVCCFTEGDTESRKHLPQAPTMAKES